VSCVAGGRAERLGRSSLVDRYAGQVGAVRGCWCGQAGVAGAGRPGVGVAGHSCGAGYRAGTNAVGRCRRPGYRTAGACSCGAEQALIRVRIAGLGWSASFQPEPGQGDGSPRLDGPMCTVAGRRAIFRRSTRSACCCSTHSVPACTLLPRRILCLSTSVIPVGSLPLPALRLSRPASSRIQQPGETELRRGMPRGSPQLIGLVRISA